MKSPIRLLNDSLIVFVLIIAGVGAFFFSRKFRDAPADLDEVRPALGSLRARLRSGNIIGCMSYSGRAETANEVANALVPAQVVPYAKRDTMLFVFKIDASDSMKHSIIAGRPTVWKAHSEHYYFILSRDSM